MFDFSIHQRNNDEIKTERYTFSLIAAVEESCFLIADLKMHYQQFLILLSSIMES